MHIGDNRTPAPQFLHELRCSRAGKSLFTGSVRHAGFFCDWLRQTNCSDRLSLCGRLRHTDLCCSLRLNTTLNLRLFRLFRIVTLALGRLVLLDVLPDSFYMLDG